MTESALSPFFFEIFDPSLPRLGPGDEQSATRALCTILSAMQQLSPALDPSVLRILDIGCGTGAQTIWLARETQANITAIDFHQPYLDELMRRADAAGLASQIRPLCLDIRKMPFQPGSFDLIWSEGAIYNLGFRNGLSICRDLLSPGGTMAITEVAWTRSEPPEECLQFWMNEYPAIQGISENLAVIRECGLHLLDHFTLPESSWWTDCYRPLEARLAMLRAKYANEQWKIEKIESIEHELDISRKYQAYVGYEFLMMQRG